MAESYPAEMVTSYQDKIQAASEIEEAFLIQNLPSLPSKNIENMKFDQDVQVDLSIIAETEAEFTFSEMISVYEKLEMGIRSEKLSINNSATDSSPKREVPFPDTCVWFAKDLKFFSSDDRRKEIIPGKIYLKQNNSFSFNSDSLQISSVAIQDFQFYGISDKERRYFALRNTSPPYQKIGDRGQRLENRDRNIFTLVADDLNSNLRHLSPKRKKLC